MHLKKAKTQECPDNSRWVGCIEYEEKDINLAHYFPDLCEAIQSSFTPVPVVLELESVVDAKGWMEHVTPALHDHLKAHQFKFQRDESGDCKMFYKEWSTDTFWLPEIGLSLLPNSK